MGCGGVAFFRDKLAVTPPAEAAEERPKALEGEEASNTASLGSSSIIGERAGLSEKWTWAVLCCWPFLLPSSGCDLAFFIAGRIGAAAAAAVEGAAE